MSNMYEYWPVGYGDRQSARKFTVDHGGMRPDEIAEAAARDYHYRGSGTDRVWPVEIALIYGGMEYRFSVEREAIPEFTAHHLGMKSAESESAESGK